MPLAADLLSHPLFVLLIGTVLSGILIPLYASWRQRKQHALEFQRTLAEKITEEVTRFVMAIQFAELGAAGQTQEEFDQAFTRWTVESEVIRTKLITYLGDEQLADEWTEFSRQLVDFYALAGVHGERERTDAVARLMSSEQLETADSFTENWARVKDAMLRRGAAFTPKVLGRRVRPLAPQLD